MAIVDYKSGDDISTYTTSYYATYAGVLANDLDGIFGIPYQFLPSVDPRILNASDIGAVYADKIMSRMPLLFLTPCKQKFMEGFNNRDKETVLQLLLSGSEDIGILDSLEGYGKYYTVEFAYDQYAKHVNNMCSELAALLGIQKKQVCMNGKWVNIGDIDWVNSKNEAFNNYFQARKSTVFYLNGFDSISDSFSNGSTESALSNTINSFSDKANEIKFLFGGDSALAQLISNSGDAISSITSALSGGIGNLMGGMIGDLAKTGVSTVLTGGKIVFPKIWQDFSFDRSYNFDIKLVSPDHDTVSIFFNLLVPYIHLLAHVLPVGMEKDLNGYTTPFLCKAYCKGMFNIDMGLVTSLQVTRGNTCQWNNDGLPTEINVSLSIEDLYSTLFMTNLTGFSNVLDTVRNTSMLDFLSNLAGLNIADEEFGRRIKMAKHIMGQELKYVDNRVWNKFDTGVNNLIARLYRAL